MGTFNQYQALQQHKSGGGYWDKDSLFHPVYCGALEKGGRHGAEHGRSPTHRPPLATEGLAPAGMVGVRHLVQDGAGGLCRPGMDKWQYISSLPGPQTTNDPLEVV